MKRIQEQVDAFDERNLFLQLGLGLLSWSRRLDALVEANALPTPSSRTGGRDLGDGAPAETLDARDRALLHFVLGLIALRNRVIDVAQRSAIDLPRDGRVGDQGAPVVASGDLLR